MMMNCVARCLATVEATFLCGPFEVKFLSYSFFKFTAWVFRPFHRHVILFLLLLGLLAFLLPLGLWYLFGNRSAPFRKFRLTQGTYTASLRWITGGHTAL